MKRFSALVGLLLFATWISGCDTPEVKGHTLYGPENRFSLALPAKPWRIVEKKKDHVLLAKKGTSETIGLFWTETSVKSMPGDLLGYHLFLGTKSRNILEKRKTKVGGLPAQWTLASITKEGVDCRVAAYSWQKDLAVFDCVYCAQKDDFEAGLPLFKDLAQSFRFLSPKKARETSKK